MSEEHRSPSAASARTSLSCEVCYQRKVRCDVHVSGVPCSRCAARKSTCALRSRKPYAYKRLTGGQYVFSLADSRRRKRKSRIRVSSDSLASEDTNTNVSTTESLRPEIQSTSPSRPTVVQGYERNRQVLDESLEGGRNDIIELTSAIIDENPRNCESSFFVGDRQGIGYIIDAMNKEGPSKPQHYLVPIKTASSLDANDLIYLKSKGCFSLPSRQVCNELIRCYFHHVHPMLPIIDTKDFLEAYVSGGIQGSNLLLLWSIFSVAGSYVTGDLLKMTTYSSRKEMKHDMYKRAKCLYENGSEKDLMTLTQSAILLSFWFSDAADHSGSSHWIGRAIVLAQTLGLHRNFDTKRMDKSLSYRRQRLWRRVWWSCFFRDRWLGLGMGRPLRVNGDDCDISFPSTSDVMDDLKDVSNAAWEAYVPPNLSDLVMTWVKLLNLTVVLGEILANYRPQKSSIRTQDIEALERRIEAAVKYGTDGEGEGSKTSFHGNLLRLHQQAALVALYRPFVSNKAVENSNEQIISPAAALRKTRSAALVTNSVLETIIQSDQVRFLGPMIPPLLVPSMHTHLIESQSENPLAGSLGAHRLDLCMLVLRELEQNYPAATMIYTLFDQAKKIKEQNREQLIQEPRRYLADRSPDGSARLPESSGNGQNFTISDNPMSEENGLFEDTLYFDPFLQFSIDFDHAVL